jgi:hypothetical protein
VLDERQPDLIVIGIDQLAQRLSRPTVGSARRSSANSGHESMVPRCRAETYVAIYPADRPLRDTH